MEAALDCFNWLANDALEQNLRLWNVQPQMHMLTHLAYDMAKEANPRRVHCYADEDMVGQMVEVGSSCLASTVCTTAMVKWIVMIFACAP